MDSILNDSRVCVAENLITKQIVNGVRNSLFVCDTWSLILREAHRLRMFENWVLRKTVGPERDEVTG
jgi:hypothetical protein